MRIFICGGTGTLGHALVRQFFKKRRFRPKVTVYSRDELKQKQMKALYPEIQFVIGDVRDSERLKEASLGHQAFFHLAALKHVDLCEEAVEECIKTNLIGSLNVSKACFTNNIGHCVFSSTDKAVLPINAYGMAKGLSERHFLELNRQQDVTKYSVFRWGNVLGSRGSVLHSFKQSLESKSLVNITHPDMTRFWIHIDDVAQFMASKYEEAKTDEAMIPVMKSAKVLDLADAVAKHLGISDYKTIISGIRPGEKIHECLFTGHDFCLRSDNCEQYNFDELCELVARSLKS